MRDDNNLTEAVKSSEAWGTQTKELQNLYYISPGPDGKDRITAHPFSGGERNRFFANTDNGNFVDLSALSGADSPADSRTSVFLDFDQDGDPDLVQTNANTPALEFFETNVPTPGAFLAIRLTGTISNRDAIGARVTVTDNQGRKLLRELRAGEGFGGQNSKELLFGLAPNGKATHVHIQWPSGQTQELIPSSPQGRLSITED